MPVQTITVINEAGSLPYALANVEAAVTAQSLQVRTAWGTPCVEFGPGGWPIYLEVGGFTDAPTHYWSAQAGPYAVVLTYGGNYNGWSQRFSHEVVEMTVDSTTAIDYTEDGTSSQLEVADPVEDHGYRLDGVWVSDFVLPGYFAGATLGACAVEDGTQWCIPATVGDADGMPQSPVVGGSLIAPADAPGPYDEIGLLTGPWQSGEADE